MAGTGAVTGTLPSLLPSLTAAGGFASIPSVLSGIGGATAAAPTVWEQIKSAIGEGGSAAGGLLNSLGGLETILPLLGGLGGYLDARNQPESTGDPVSRDFLRQHMTKAPTTPWGKY
jgi:hypothetical protein